MARKLSAITLLAAALSFVRPYEMPGASHPALGRATLWTAPPTDDLRPPPQVAQLYRGHESATDLAIVPATRSHLLGSLVRQVV
jgi:hypothetical protein